MSITIVKDEKDKKKDELRERYHRGDPSADLTGLDNPAPEKRYRWVNRNPKRIAHFKKEGYEITPATDKAHAIFTTGTEDGGQVMGDLVLMETSMENYKRRVERAKEKDRRMRSAYRDSAREEIRRLARQAGHNDRRDLTFDESGN